MHFCSLGLLLLSWLGSLEAARILAVLPLAARSHFIVGEAVLKALADKGHDITVYSALAPKPNPRIKHVDLETKHNQQFNDGVPFEFLLKIVNSKSYFGLMGPQIIWYMTLPLCEQVMEHPNIHQLLASDQKFDLVITEALFAQESMLVFSHKFKAPSVTIDTFGIWSVLNRISGNELQISHQPERASLGFAHNMTFMERFRNTVSSTAALLMYRYLYLPKQQQLLDKTLGDKAPNIYDLIDDISLSLVNWHPSIDPASVSPNLVPIGGIHIKNTSDPLPKDIAEFMDGGKSGVIYFSLGSIVPVHKMPSELIQVFVRVFAKLPYRVLWKTEAKDIPNLSANVKTAKWLPQQSVLAHPNLALFITHGGLLSQLEAFHAGVPVIGIPFFGDQPHNVQRYESMGIGRVLNFHDISEEAMTERIVSVINEPGYAAAAKRLSQVYHHRPMSPADSAVFWVEHVMRYGGPHLSPYARRLSFVQVQLLDVWAAMLAVLVATILLLRFIFIFVCCRKKNHLPSATSSKKKTN